MRYEVTYIEGITIHREIMATFNQALNYVETLKYFNDIDNIIITQLGEDEP